MSAGSDICNQCMERVGVPEKIIQVAHMRGLISKQESAAGLSVNIDCTYCGVNCKVNHLGDCISASCSHTHGDY